MIKLFVTAALVTVNTHTVTDVTHIMQRELQNTPGISAEYHPGKKAVYIKWLQQSGGIKTFVVQRSRDNFSWTGINRIENISFSGLKKWQYADINPGEGENYYRLQCLFTNGTAAFSASVMVITGRSHNWVMYPVPVKDLLTLQYRGTAKIEGVIHVQLQNLQGTFFNRMRFASNSTLIKIPVANLGRGVYDIRVIIEEEIVWNQRFVK